MINELSTSAYLLVIHGSQDPQPLDAARQLATMVRQQLEFSSGSYQNLVNQGFPTNLEISPIQTIIGVASLELAPLPLSQSIQQFASQAQDAGCREIRILPLFLLDGVHVQTDIPIQVKLAQQLLGEGIKLHLYPHLGCHPEMVGLLEEQFSLMPSQARVLLSHGSRRLHANQNIAAIASQLKALAAYWSVVPSLEQQVTNLATQNYQTIAIVPYFLFSGGITKAITSQVQQLQTNFPQTKLFLGKPIGASTQLAELIVNLFHFRKEKFLSSFV